MSISIGSGEFEKNDHGIGDQTIPDARSQVDSTSGHALRAQHNLGDENLALQRFGGIVRRIARGVMRGRRLEGAPGQLPAGSPQPPNRTERNQPPHDEPRRREIARYTEASELLEMYLGQLHDLRDARMRPSEALLQMDLRLLPYMVEMMNQGSHETELIQFETIGEFIDYIDTLRGDPFRFRAIVSVDNAPSARQIGLDVYWSGIRTSVVGVDGNVVTNLAVDFQAWLHNRRSSARSLVWRTHTESGPPSVIRSLYHVQQMLEHADQFMQYHQLVLQGATNDQLLGHVSGFSPYRIVPNGSFFLPPSLMRYSDSPDRLETDAGARARLNARDSPELRQRDAQQMNEILEECKNDVVERIDVTSTISQTKYSAGIERPRISFVQQTRDYVNGRVRELADTNEA